MTTTNVTVDLGDVYASLDVTINEENDLTADMVGYELKAVAAAAMLALGYHQDLVARYIYDEDV